MDARTRHWQPSAAYLYVLHLDEPSLAWEYLRRNHAYQQDWRRHALEKRLQRHEAAWSWGLRMFENPALDARDTQPDWITDPDRLLLIQLDADPPAAASPFGFWKLPGRKQLSHDGRRLLLSCQLVGRVLRMAISPILEDGMAYLVSVRAGSCLCRRWREIESEFSLLLDAAEPSPVAADRPSRTALLHMRTLQALDGMQADASQREIAEMLFGAESVAERWHDDSELRAQVRRLIRRGRTLMTGGYRHLLQLGSTRKGR